MTAQKHKLKKHKTPVTAEPLFFKKLFWIIPALTLIVLLPLLGHEFINYDDDWMIFENKYLATLSAENIKALFTSFYYGQYSPLATTIAGIFFHLGPGGVVPLKVGAIIIHLLNVIMVYKVFRQLMGSFRLAAIASLFFAVHPVQMEAVAWLSASYKVGLFTLFTLLGIFFWIKHLDSGKLHFFIWAFLSMVLACFSKEQALVFPLFILLVAWYKGAKVFSVPVITKMALFALVGLVFLMVTYYAAESRNEVRVLDYPLRDRIFFLGYSFVSYLRLLLFPARLAPFYGFPETGAAGYLLYPALAIGALILGFKAAKADKRVLFSFAFFLGTLLLSFALQVVSLRETLYADRYLYLGVPAFFIGLVILFEKVLKKNLDIPLLVVALIFTTLSLQRATVFKNSETIWSDAIKNKYNNPLAYNNRGHFYQQNNQAEKALADYNEALKINPDYPLSLNNRGNIYFNLGQIDQAMADYNKCLTIAPEFARALANRAAALGQKGDFGAALADLDKALLLEPENLNALSNRALTLYSMSRFDNAIADIDHYLWLKPNDANLYNLRALCFSNLGNESEALANFNRAIELMPERGIFYQNRSFYYHRNGDRESAQKDIRRAMELGVVADAAYLQEIGFEK